MASPNAKDFAKKKKANRLAKLKQCKLDARREQWLSQVKNKGGAKEGMRGVGSPRGPPSQGIEDSPMEKLRGQEEILGDGSLMNNCSDSEFSPSNSPTSILGRNDSEVNFTASSRSGSGRSSSSSSNGCCSESMSEGDVGDVGGDGCLDDWEAAADALAACDKKPQVHGPQSAFGSLHPGNHGNGTRIDSLFGVRNKAYFVHDVNSESGRTAMQRVPINRQAWSSYDAFRPQSLPSLSKQDSFPICKERCFGGGGTSCGSNNVAPVPKSCPICCEDLDCTDCSFLPCSCGFMLCLFCHKRILEHDGRCPGCRKQYDGLSRERQQWKEAA